MSILLETQRLIIKSPIARDLDDLYLLQADPKVMQYIGNGVRSMTEVQEGLAKAIAHQQKHGFSLGSVYEKTTGHFVGRAGLIYLAYDDTQPEIEIGYALIPSAWGQGYATELAHALITWGFQHLTVDRLCGVTQPDNAGSRHVLEKAQMSYVGRSQYRDKEVAMYVIERAVKL